MTKDLAGGTEVALHDGFLDKVDENLKKAMAA
jgi:hypothetical protein